MMAPAGVEPDAYTLVQPDVFVVPLLQGRKPRDWGEAGRMFLAAEVLSPGSGRHDRVTKHRLYARMGVPEYWIVDADARVLKRWRPGDERGELIEERLEWTPEGASRPFVLDLASFFAEVRGE